MTSFATAAVLAAGAALGVSAGRARAHYEQVGFAASAAFALVGVVANMADELIVAVLCAGLSGGLGWSSVVQRREARIEAHLRQALRELEVRDRTGNIINARAIELMTPALESRLRRGRPASTYPAEPSANFVLADQDGLTNQFGALVFASGETSNRVTACGVLWHSRKLGRSEHQWALRLEHVIDAPQLPSLRRHVEHWAANSEWSVSATTPHTNRSNGLIVLTLSNPGDSNHDETASDLYAALNRLPQPAPGPTRRR